MNIDDRFRAKVNVEEDSECWPWGGHVGPNGYGTFWMDGKTMVAHRVAFLLEHGQWPGGQVDHVCHNEDMTCVNRGSDCPHRRCVNPSHLADVTGSQNQQARRSRCRLRGHPWATEGVDYKVMANGTWQCLHCAKEYRKRRAEHGEKHRSDTCKRGHDLTDPEVAYHAPDGRRQCRICRNINQRVSNPMSASEAGKRGAASRWGKDVH